MAVKASSAGKITMLLLVQTEIEDSPSTQSHVISVFGDIMHTDSGAGFLKGMDDTVVCRGWGLGRQETL